MDTFWATSAAAAQAAGMAATIMARHPEYWPETVRALIVHSATWTPAMRNRLADCDGKKERILQARHFGYGVPRLDRALSSAENDLALIAESHIQPFKRDRTADESGRTQLGAVTFNEVHYFTLPWPRQSLEDLGEKTVQLKVTLSYFVEPSPGQAAPVSPAMYQSYGLRFELKRADEGVAAFGMRINQKERTGDIPPTAAQDNGWTFGPRSVAAGSLHCDVWVGRAVDLAARGIIAVYPVSGWWRYRAHLKRFESKARYCLVVSILSDDQETQLYSEIANLISLETEITT